MKATHIPIRPRFPKFNPVPSRAEDVPLNSNDSTQEDVFDTFELNETEAPIEMTDQSSENTSKRKTYDWMIITMSVVILVLILVIIWLILSNNDEQVPEKVISGPYGSPPNIQGNTGYSNQYNPQVNPYYRPPSTPYMHPQSSAASNTPSTSMQSSTAPVASAQSATSSSAHMTPTPHSGATASSPLESRQQQSAGQLNEDQRKKTSQKELDDIYKNLKKDKPLPTLQTIYEKDNESDDESEYINTPTLDEVSE